MKSIRILYLLLFILSASSAGAQILDTGHKVDTLSTRQRIALRTNGMEWLCLVPNIGVEYDLSKFNYGRWALTFDLRSNWNTSHTYKPGIVYNLTGARVGVKYYYRMHKPGRGDTYPQLPTNKLKRPFSSVTENPKHPTIAFYRGAFLSFDKYSFMFGSEGKQGSAITAGLSWGFTKPLYSFQNGNSIDFEAGISAGFCYASVDKYKLNRESNCYEVTEKKSAAFQPIPVINDLRLGFIYRVGDYPHTKKYRWRYDCDLVYQQQMDDLMTAEKNRRDSIANARKDHGSIFEEFMNIYNQELKRFAEEEAKTTAENVANVKVAKAAADAKAAELKAAKKQGKNDAKAAEKDAKDKKTKKDKKAEKENSDAEQPAAEQSEAPEEKPADNTEPTTEQSEDTQAEPTTEQSEDTQAEPSAETSETQENENNNKN